MFEELLALFQISFAQQALFAIIPLSLLCGIIGSLISINRLSYVAGGLTHGAYGGIGLGVFLSFPILLSIFAWTFILALLMAWLLLKYRTFSDHLIGAIWAFGMAMGIILIELSEGYKGDMLGYLFGNILVLSNLNLWVMVGLACVVLAITIFFFPQFQALSYDSEFAKLRGVASKQFFYLLIVMIAFCVASTMQAVGLILVIALLSIPTFIAQNLSHSLKTMMILSSILNFVFCFLGLILSFILNLSSGASIILVASLGFILFFLYRSTRGNVF